MLKITNLYLLICLLITCMFFGFAGFAFAADSAWDADQQLVLVRGISVDGRNDNVNYYAVMHLEDTSQGTWIFELKEVNIDAEPGKAVFYPDTMSLNFPVLVGDLVYDVWMKMVQGQSGRTFLYITSAEPIGY